MSDPAKMTLRQARERSGLGRERAIRELDISSKTLERWEKLNRAPAWQVAKLAKLYGVRVSQIEYEAAPARSVA